MFQLGFRILLIAYFVMDGMVITVLFEGRRRRQTVDCMGLAHTALQGKGQGNRVTADIRPNAH